MNCSHTNIFICCLFDFFLSVCLKTAMSFMIQLNPANAEICCKCCRTFSLPVSIGMRTSVLVILYVEQIHVCVLFIIFFACASCDFGSCILCVFYLLPTSGILTILASGINVLLCYLMLWRFISSNLIYVRFCNYVFCSIFSSAILSQ